MVYLGEEALEFGLIDEIGSKQEAIKFLETKLNITVKIVEFQTKKSFLDVFAGLTASHGFYSGMGSNIVQT